ncbi:hypothetical protein KBC99_01335 [Candidatus Saccharibacteria bacterium]|nr:hypothetical protein [Candidatus Saccharibacteria bacterium]
MAQQESIKTLADIVRFAQEQNSFSSSLHDTEQTTVEAGAYRRIVKLNEEVGELCESVLAHFGKQKTKPDKQASPVADEIADVVLITAVLVTHLNIDLQSALETKWASVRKRREAILKTHHKKS